MYDLVFFDGQDETEPESQEVVLGLMIIYIGTALSLDIVENVEKSKKMWLVGQYATALKQLKQTI